MTTKTRIEKLEKRTPKTTPPSLTDGEFINRLEKFLHADPDPDPKNDPGGMYERGARALRSFLQDTGKKGKP